MRKALAIGLFAWSLLAVQAQAITIYSSESSFFANTTVDQTSDFEDLPSSGLGDTATIDGLTYTTINPTSNLPTGTLLRAVPG